MSTSRTKTGPPSSARPRPRPDGPIEPSPPTERLPRLLDSIEIETDITSRTSRTAIKVSPSGQPKRAILTVLTGLSAGQVFTLASGETYIGRSHKCQLRLFDQGISRIHCKITGAPGGRHVLEDLESTNGTYIDGKRVHRAYLRGGERAQIGSDVVLRFAFSDEAEEALAKRLYESSTRDPLTRAFTRKYLEERMESELAYARRHKTAFGVIMFDLDHFKSINDNHGHAAGDAVLRKVSDRVLHTIRAEDVFARYGGEEFIILVRGIKPKNMMHFAERVRKAVAQARISFGGRGLEATLSLGVASLNEIDDDAGPADLLDLADKRVYIAKKQGRNRTCAG